LRVDYSKLVNEDFSVGYTGSSSDFICRAIVTFAEIGVVEYQYDIEMRLTKPDITTPELLLIPSLLGRDILNQWKMSFDPKERMITADVLSCTQQNSLRCD
jgi:hypothetical protein